jgi:hypothetical protein
VRIASRHPNAICDRLHRYPAMAGRYDQYGTAILWASSVATNIFDNHVFTQVGDVEPCTGTVIEFLATAYNGMAHSNSNRVTIGALTTGLEISAEPGGVLSQ